MFHQWNPKYTPLNLNMKLIPQDIIISNNLYAQFSFFLSFIQIENQNKNSIPYVSLLNLKTLNTKSNEIDTTKTRINQPSTYYRKQNQ